MKNRLQFNYYKPAKFPYSREAAEKFIEQLFSKNADSVISLPAEPVVVFYGETSDTSNVLLAIGRGGNGTNILDNEPYFVIDYAKSVEEIAALWVDCKRTDEEIAAINEELAAIQKNIDEIEANLAEEIARATGREDEIEAALNEEVARAKDAEKAEYDRALAAEHDLSVAIQKEQVRAESAEAAIQADVDKNEEHCAGVEKALETLTNDNRTQHQELRTSFENADAVLSANILQVHDELAEAVAAEQARAEVKEGDILKALNDEVARATAAEQAEVARAKDAEKAEYDRALAAEGGLSDRITNLNADLGNAKAQIVSNKVSSANKTVIVQTTEGTGTDISANIDGKTIKADALTGVMSVSVSPNDKVLLFDNNGLNTQISLRWDKASDGVDGDYLLLLGKDDTVISRIDIAGFLKDGILDNVQFSDDRKNIIFTFNTGDIITLPVENLIDVYTAGDGLQENSNVFSINVDPQTENFLTVTASGIKVTGVQAAIDTAKADLTTVINSMDAAYKAADTTLQENISTMTQGVRDSIAAVDERVNVLNGDVNTPGSVKNILSETIVANVVTNITPDYVSGQTLLRIVDNKVYASNSAKDIIYENESGDTKTVNNVLTDLIARNAALEAKVAELESAEYKESLYNEFAHRILSAISGTTQEIGVTQTVDATTSNVTGITLGFAEGTLFQAGV